MACARVCSKIQGEPAMRGAASARREIAEEHSTTRDRHGPASLVDSFSKHLVRQEMRPGDNKCSGSLRPFSLEGDEPSSVGTRSATSRNGYLTDPPSHDVSTCHCFNLSGLASSAKSRMWCLAAALCLSLPFSPFSLFILLPLCFYVLVVAGSRVPDSEAGGGWLRIRRGGSSLSQTERFRLVLEYGHCFF